MWVCRIREWIGTLLHLRQGWRELWKVVLLRLKLLILLVYVRQACEWFGVGLLFYVLNIYIFFFFCKIRFGCLWHLLAVVVSWFNIIEFILFNCIHNSFCCNSDLWFYEDQFGFYIFWKTFPSAPRESPTFCFLIYSYQNFTLLSLSFSH